MENKQSYFTISELAKEFDVKKSHIRFCEEKGLISPRVSKLGRRTYNKYDRARLKLIFHCVLIGYSQDQIIELIGTPDVNLDEMGQIRKSLEYGEKKLDELVKLSRELKFHQRTSTRTEINMLHEYVEELKIIKPAIVDEPEAEPHIPKEERKEPAPKPIEVIEPELEKKPERKPARMIPVYVTGLALILIVAGYFYYEGGKKETKTLDLAQREQPKTETRSIYHDSVPPDDTGDQQDLSLQPSETPAFPIPIQKDDLIEKSEELVEQGSPEEKAETAILLSEAAPPEPSDSLLKPEKPIEKKLPGVKETVVPEKEEKIIKKLPVTKVEEEQQPKPLAPVVPVPKETPSAPEKKEAVSAPDKQVLAAEVKEAVSPPDKQVLEAEVKESPVKEKPIVEAPPAVTDKGQLLAAVPKAEKEAAPVAKVEEEQQPKPLAPVAPVPRETPSPPEKKEAVSPPDKQVLAAEVKESTVTEESVVEEPSVDTDKDQLLAAAPKAESPGAVEEIKPSIEAEEEKEFVASKGEILDREEQTDRLKSFLNIYCQTYENKDIDKFATFFAPDATENNRPFHELLPKYRRNMEKIESFNYRIELIAYSLQADTGNVKIQGKFFTRYLLHGGAWKENSGSISMELAESGDSYLVKQLNYGK